MWKLVTFLIAIMLCTSAAADYLNKDDYVYFQVTNTENNPYGEKKCAVVIRHSDGTTLEVTSFMIYYDQKADFVRWEDNLFIIHVHHSYESYLKVVNLKTGDCYDLDLRHPDYVKLGGHSSSLVLFFTQ